MESNRNPDLSTFEIAELYLSGNYEFPLLRNEDGDSTYANPRLLKKLKQGMGESLFVKPMQNFPLLASERTHRLSRKVLDVFLDREDNDSDEVLRQEGFYDSTDKRSCINRTRR